MRLPLIALVDCNSFYCSCERLFRPDLKHRPVGVLSNNDGCFVSRTNELKKLGVPMGAPYFKYKAICDKNKVAIFSANFSLYTNLSDRVMNTLFDFTPSLEIYSVDEAFLDLTGLDEKSIVDYCKKIKETVEKNTGIPVGIGIARTKVLAKVANRIAKKNPHFDGVCSLLETTIREISLAEFPVEDLWGVGRQNAIKMKMLKIKTAKDLRDFENTLLIQKEFTKIGRMIQDELKEITCFPINEETPKKKEIMTGRTFGHPVFDLASMRESIAAYTSMAAEKLRKQKSVCGGIEIAIRTNPFKDVAQYIRVDSTTLANKTSDTRKLIHAAFLLLDHIFISGFEYKKASVRLFDIGESDEYQLSLIGGDDTLEDRTLMAVIDQINLRDGQETIKSMACGTDKSSWQMKQIYKSPKFVTGWSQLKKI